ncbi:MAG: acyl-CoA dehydrogenase [Bdellovibrionales bacterium RIFOXYD12_FULL_39_22]|nr:MAG: acyl-CoA dehydrogenase [Bdellovibrionales bacterium RIFOXYB1_FULL_39_21]OFZ41683.1 MAG: acyl-CoA dehydrogenase [Bdellovibrionales bacterium RIFOXYC12_FULL_39_17]OFZ46083.1 MAG: acyl-CoA dehydrogenase [Bdellovibrionales bacterium RIFOXYC1_FULL_39_130]OFZ74910.1 MAG: acyl-CoA dehydrogenase [Bdellovibrionales bacterium RIFOXYD1_FULL_39_84]OFZ75143.1 MAG: acyl-CoA dehydrogenase [Bdellovibrionales bacterium RIFOXYC2_FULL_39_8]OFZ92763.1 MAG: acyl-CoA dehydrogenase [Bdellovibrionales bacteri
MLNELQTELISQLEKFRKEKIEPFAEADDHAEKFRMDIFKQLGALGFTGMTTPEDFGGVGLTYQDLCTALIELSKSSVSYAVTVSVSSMVQSIINEYGNDEQKSKYLPELASGEAIGAFALTESSAGSDAASLLTTAKKTAKGYILNGSKIFITSGGIAKTYIVMARTGGEGAAGISAFIVEDGRAGFSYGKKERKMGWKVSPTRELIFENCLVPEENMLRKEGVGFKIAMSALDRGRITIGSIGVGLAERALDEAMKYALERKQFKKSIFDFQALQFMLADMATEIESSRLLVRQAAKLFDEKRNDQKLASMAKLKATDTAMKVTTDAVQILGGVGYTSEYPLERFMRDAKVLQIVEGTNQIQRVVIARKLKGEYDS